MILDRVENEIGGMFDGTNRGAVTMNDLDLMIKKAAKNVYARLFETSELLAANRSSTLFVERLYQTHGDLVNGEVRESAEQLLADAAASGVAPLEPSLRRDPNAFALRYRAQRIIYDCLSDNVEAISSNESGMATPAEISKGVLDVTQQQCAKWASGAIDRRGRQGQGARPDAAAGHLDRRGPEGRPLDVRPRDGSAVGAGSGVSSNLQSPRRVSRPRA